MEFKRVSKKAKAKWRLDYFLGFLALTAVSAFAVLTAGDGAGFSDVQTIVLICCGAVVLVQALCGIICPQIEYVQWAYLITDDRIEIKKGIIWRSHTVIPASRIQHVCAKQGPIQRLFGLATVAIHTAGGLHEIKQLDKSTADEICALLQGHVNRKLAAAKEQVSCQ